MAPARFASVRSAPSRLQPVRSHLLRLAPTRTPRRRLAWRRSACSRNPLDILAPSKFAPTRTAAERLVSGSFRACFRSPFSAAISMPSRRSARVRLQRTITASRSLAPRRSAPTREACLRSAPVRSAPNSKAPRRSAPRKLAWRKSAPVRSASARRRPLKSKLERLRNLRVARLPTQPTQKLFVLRQSILDLIHLDLTEGVLLFVIGGRTLHVGMVPGSGCELGRRFPPQLEAVSLRNV